MTVALRWAALDSWNIARRDVLRWVANPTRVLAELGFSACFVLLFGYVFGSGMTVPGGGDYLEFLMPGLFAQFTAFGVGATMQEIASDAERGITDRFRSLPISPVAVVAGRAMADMLNSIAGLAITIGVGLAVGWSWHGGTADALAALGLLLLLRFAFLWIGILLGLIAPSADAVNALWMLLFPITMLTSAFVAPELMPGWLGFLAEWNPLSSTITATRELFDNPGVPAEGGSWVVDHALALAVVWPVVLVAVFLPLAVWRFQRLSR
ncbi:ABC transporter permease [Conexibacter sp. SYSU D00693]|uniref:ABC transporter permease n=1 Tax=Conexibacter sp. SYSU D00693 TaxID=2812560 RepID=UPI00196A6E92|nr:ABC transporter permease [Conexibacter sp. SYSU D00693]